LLFLFAFVSNVLDDFLGVLTDAWVASIGAFDHVDSILETRPWMWPATAIATKRAFQSTAKYCVAICIIVGLPDVVESGVGLFWITGAELIEEAVEDKGSGKADDLRADLCLDCGRVCLSQGEVEFGAKQVDGPVLKGMRQDIASEVGGRHGTEVSVNEPRSDVIGLVVAIVMSCVLCGSLM
jgi:hypothetical protein